MSDTEIIVDDVTTDVDTDIDTTDGSDVTTLTEEDYYKEKARREKAEKALVDLKKKAKELEGKSSESSDVMTKADYALEKFLDKNPELEGYKDELSKYTSKGLSYDEAKTLILNSDKTKQAREKVNSLGLSDGDASSKKSSYTMSDLDKLASNNPNEYARVRNEMDAGKIKLVR